MPAVPEACLKLIFDLLQPAWSDGLVKSMLVCRRWRKLILGNGQYWADIRIPVPAELMGKARFSTPASRLALLEMASGRAIAQKTLIKLTVVGETGGSPFHGPYYAAAARAGIMELMRSDKLASLALLSPGFQDILDGTYPMPSLESLTTDPLAPFDVARAPKLRAFGGAFSPALNTAVARLPDRLTSIDVSLRDIDASNFFAWFPLLERLVLRDIGANLTARLPVQGPRKPLRHIGWHGEPGARGALPGSLRDIPRQWICGPRVSVAVVAYNPSDAVSVGCAVLQPLLEESGAPQWEVMDVSGSAVPVVRLTAHGGPGACSLTAEVRGMPLTQSSRIVGLLHAAARPERTRIPISVIHALATTGTPRDKIELTTRLFTIVYSSYHTDSNQNIVWDPRVGKENWLQLHGVQRVSLVVAGGGSDLQTSMRVWARSNLRNFLTRSISPNIEARQIPEVHLEGIEEPDVAQMASWREHVNATESSWTAGPTGTLGTLILTGIQCPSMVQHPFRV